MRITIEDPATPDIVALLEAGEAHSASLYPADSNHHLPLDALRAPAVRFHAAREPDGRLLGTGALVLNGDWAEIKRMWVVPEARGRGVARRVLAALETAAATAGVRVLRLETGVRSAAALALYAGAGFERIGPFADYPPDPNCVFMEKRLA